MFYEDNKIIIESKGNIDVFIFNSFCKYLKNEFSKINDFFEINSKKIKITLLEKRELDNVVKQKSRQYKKAEIPYWLVGFSTFEEVFVVTPTEKTFDELYKVALHEITHLISYKLDVSHNRLKLLDEGIAVFLSNQYAGKILTPWVNSYLRNNLPKVSDFCTYDSIEFAARKGYQYSHYIVEFLINTYGKNVFLDWLQNPCKFLQKVNEIDLEFNAYIIQKIEARIK